MAQWFSIEVLDGAYSAAGWAEAFGDSLVTEALCDGALDWGFHPHSWGTIFDVQFPDEAAWARFRASLAALRALDATPDPVTGVIIYKGRGGDTGGRVPRRGRPLTGSGAAALAVPLPLDADGWNVFPASPQRLLSLGA
ncbi:MAG: hypothetical protein ACHQNA_10770 [Acidimicrobiales bacterium]